MRPVKTSDCFCWQCTLAFEWESPSANDFVGLCGRSDNVLVYCAGCRAVIWVDYKGRRVAVESRSPAASPSPSRPSRLKAMSNG